MGKYILLPTCDRVLSTYDVSHVINFTRLSPFCILFTHGESLGMRLELEHMKPNLASFPLIVVSMQISLLSKHWVSETLSLEVSWE